MVGVSWGIFPNSPPAGEYSPIESFFDYFEKRFDLSGNSVILTYVT